MTTGLNLNKLINNLIKKLKLLFEFSKNGNSSESSNFRFIEKFSLQIVFNLLNKHLKKYGDNR